MYNCKIKVLLTSNTHFTHLLDFPRIGFRVHLFQYYYFFIADYEVLLNINMFLKGIIILIDNSVDNKHVLKRLEKNIFLSLFYLQPFYY